MDKTQKLKEDYPWIQTPLVVGAPMRLIALADMAVEISKAGGIGFIGAGTDVSDVRSHLDKATHLVESSSLATTTTANTLPLGIGFINWGADLSAAIALIGEYRPAAVWFFAPSSLSSLQTWATQTRAASPATKIWVQIGSVHEALDALASIQPDVLVVQGSDAGGHGLARSASLLTLLPEVDDAVGSGSRASSSSLSGPALVAAGGISDARGAAAALVLGAQGVCMGTRFLASPEANLSAGYRACVLRATDGGQATARTAVYDSLRGTPLWPHTHNARAILNASYWDHVAGLPLEENKALYQKDLASGDAGWAENGRMTAYAGSGVGLVRGVKGAGEIVGEVREGARGLLLGRG
ncbi:hypothetical protein ACEQ8H_000168 [Pleosporales sp. CAS-2024a]